MQIPEAFDDTLKVLRAGRDRTVEEAVDAFFGHVDRDRPPSDVELTAGLSVARQKLRAFISSDECTAGVFSNLSVAERSDAEYTTLKYMPDPLAPAPPIVPGELVAARVALAATVGALLGSILFGVLTNWLLDMRDTGLLLGPALGAGIVTVSAITIGKRPFLKKIMAFFLGAAAASEFVSMGLSAFGVRGLWSRIGFRSTGGVVSSLKRALVFVLLIPLLYISTSTTSRLLRDEFRQSVKSSFSAWLDQAIGVAVLLQAQKNIPGNTEGTDSTTKMVEVLGQQLVSLSRMSPEQLPDGVEELLQEARNLGYEGISHGFGGDGGSAGRVREFSWSSKDSDRFTVYGHVEIGDQVVVEDEPVVFQGVIRKRGLVRKSRKAT